MAMKRDQDPGPSEFSHGRGLDPLGVQRYRGRAASETVSDGLSADAVRSIASVSRRGER